MGVKKFNITGFDYINKDFKSFHYFNKDSDTYADITIGFDTFNMLYYECILDYTKFDITLYSDESNANILIPRYKKLDMNYHIFNNFLIVNIENLLKEIKNINKNQILYLKIVEYIIINKINILLGLIKYKRTYLSCK
jgi:hypothetical protein